MVASPLTTRFALTTDYSSRGGTKIDSIGHHHAASTSLEGTLSLFQPGGREVSPNYCIHRKDIVQVVPEEFRAWTSASGVDDARSITYEIVNETGDPNWSFHPDTIASVIALDAEISQRYGITPRHAMPGYWQHKDLYAWFNRSYATSCAGPSFNIDQIIDGVIHAAVAILVAEGVDMSTSRIVADPRNGTLYFMDPIAVDKVADFVSGDMDNPTVVAALNGAFGKYHTPGSAWEFDVLKAIMERRAEANQGTLVEALTAAVAP